MKQILQNLSNGDTICEEVPCPQVKPGHLLIRTHTSLVSAGTERMLVEFGKAGYLQKAKQQPEKVKQVLDKIKTDGLMPTIEAVKSKLDQPLPLGYSNVGHVIAVGDGVSGFKIGDRVVSNGHHAQVVCVPKNLCALIPSDVTDEQAAFTVVGAIGLQGIRLAQPTLGETFAVIGLGLIGLVTAQILKAHGCRVFGIDLDSRKIELAQSLGIEGIDLSKGEDPIAKANHLTQGNGIDGVLITASTKSNEPVHQAAQMCRKRGRIILVGVTGLELMRSDFYEKELSFQVSCSYGPGRYDSQYEEQGQDYPIGYVRWTEQRNFESILGLLSQSKLDVNPLVTHRYDLDRAQDAYNTLSEDSSCLGIVLTYPNEAATSDEELRKSHIELVPTTPTKADEVSIAVIGAGNYSSRVLVPAFKTANATLNTIISQGGTSAKLNAEKLGFNAASTNADDTIQNSSNNTVVIATQHDSHAEYVLKALDAKKHVFVEKPLCLTLDELDKIQAASQANPNQHLMVGFNRRFSPLIEKVTELLKQHSGPKSFLMTVNAGEIPKDHWTQNPKTGGGRLLGEACHFIDLLRFLANSPIDTSSVASMSQTADGISSDKISITLTFKDGSMGTILYLANGHRSFPKERLEVFSNGQILQLDNFRKLTGYGWQGFSKLKMGRQDKGQINCIQNFVNAIKSGLPTPISKDEIFEVARVTIELAEKVQTV